MKAFAANANVRRECLKYCETPCSSKSKSTHSKIKRLSNVEVPEFMLMNNTADDDQLQGIVKEHHGLGEKDLYRFVVKKTIKVISDLVKTTWRIHSDPEVVRCEKTSRIDTVKALLLSGEYVPQCEGEWLRPAKEVLKQNGFMFLMQLLEMPSLKGAKKITTSC